MQEVPVILPAFIFGTVLGSFINVVVLRYVEGVRRSTDTSGQSGSAWSLMSRSQCMACHQTLRWWELVPVVSWLALRGRCQRCGVRISWQYPLVELAMGLLTVWLVRQGLQQAVSAGTIGLVVAIAGTLLVLGLIDWYTFLLPHRYLAVLAGLVLLRLVAAGTLLSREPVLGAVAGAGFLGALWLATRGRGLGLGDVKLLVPLGALFGLGVTVVLLYVAFCVGGVYGIWLLSTGRAKLTTPVPFGPMLTGSALALLLWPELPAWFFTLLLGLR